LNISLPYLAEPSYAIKKLHFLERISICTREYDIYVESSSITEG